MEDTDEFDDFLFESITRYHTLQMFTLENIPENILQLDDFSICVSSQRIKGNNSELLRLQLPKKLILPPEDEGRSKENDFKVMSGAYSEGPVCSLGRLMSNTKILTSEKGVKGLKIYDHSNNKISGTWQEECLSVIPWLTPNFSVLKQTNSVVCTKCSKDALLVVDVETKKIIKETNYQGALPESKYSKNLNDNVECEALNKDLIAVLNTVSADLFLHDIRTNDVFINLPSIDAKQDDEMWSISRHDSSNSFNYIGILSNKQNFYIYDRVKNCKLVERTGMNFKKVENNCFKLKFCKNESMFSISGFDSNVSIYKFSGISFSHVFTHNGHSPSNLPSDFVTDHLWLSITNKQLVVSICNNKTLNCWEFNEKIRTT